jgi:hypothetical protein
VGRACGTHGRGEKLVQPFVWEAQRKSPFGRPKLYWEDGIKMDLTEIGWGFGLDSPGSGQRKLAG